MKNFIFFNCFVIYIFSSLSANCQIKAQESLVFDKNTGRLSAYLPDGSPLFKNAMFAIKTKDGIKISDEKKYKFEIFKKTPGNGLSELTIKGIDKAKQLNFISTVKFNQLNLVTEIETIYRNVSNRDINIRSIDVLRILKQETGELNFSNAKKCLTNGAMYYDAGQIHEFDKPYIKMYPYGEAKGGVPEDSAIINDPLTAQSWWNISLFNSDNSPSLVLGYLQNKNGLGRLQVRKEDNQHLSFIGESVLCKGFILKSQQEISSDKFVIVAGNSPYKALETYATLMQEESHGKTGTINGWCNWFYTMNDFSEDEILKNARFASETLKPYGLEYIQIDEGFQRAHGNWEGNKKFPHGLKWFCDSIKSLGLKPGIWIAPFVISENTDVYIHHKDWLIKDEAGHPARIGPWPSDTTAWYRDEIPKRYCLDITNPDAFKWYKNLMDTVINFWGFKMIKIDFVAWTVFSANKFYNPSYTPAQVYRLSMKTIRDIGGDDIQILDCGPGNVSSGYINSMRIEYDQNYGTDADAWRQYFIGNSCSAGAAGKRYYFNKVWTNDIDHVCLDILSNSNARAVATLIGLSGGNTMSGDKLYNLPDYKIDLLKKIFPSTPEQAIPVKLYDHDPQNVFICHIEKPFGKWDVLAIFNPDQKNALSYKVDFASLKLDASKSYLWFDFWNEKFLGEIKNDTVLSINPGDVLLCSIHEKTKQPEVISTNRHVKQGAVELLQTQYDSANNILKGTSFSPKGSRHSVYIYVPENFYWVPANGVIYEDSENIRVRSVNQRILRMDIDFKNSDTMSWQVSFKKSINK